MKRQTGLFDQITPFGNLRLAARKAARGKRDKPTVARFEFHLERELLALQEQLVNGGYRPGAFTGASREGSRAKLHSEESRARAATVMRRSAS